MPTCIPDPLLDKLGVTLVVLYNSSRKTITKTSLAFRFRVLVPARARSPSIRVSGIFPGAKVVRGHNWKWGNQDGISIHLNHVLAHIYVYMYHSLALYLNPWT